MDEWGGCIGALIVLAIVIWAIYAFLLSLAYVGMSVLIAIEFVAHGLFPIGVTNPTLAWLLLGILGGGAVGFALGFQRAGKKSAVPVVGIIGAVVLIGLVAGSGSVPTTTRQTVRLAPAQMVSFPGGGSQWRGMVGGSPASLDLIQQTIGGWTGRMTYQGVVEELAVSINDGGATVLAGKSYRRFKGKGSFSLDTFYGQLSADAQRIQGSYVDSAGKRGQWSVARTAAVNTRLESKPQEPDRSGLVATWQGTVATSAATLDIIQNGSALAGSMRYLGVVEELDVIANNDGSVTLKGTSFQRISGNGSFQLDTFSGVLTPDRQRMSGTYVDTAGNRGQWNVARVPGSSAQKPRVGEDATPPANHSTESPDATPSAKGATSQSLDEIASLVDSEINSGNYDRALADAERGVRLYPGNTRAQALVEKVRKIRLILK